MLPFFATFVSLLASCREPVPRSRNLIIPQALGDVAYGSRYAIDAYAPAGDPRPAAVIIHGSSGSRSTRVDQLFTSLDEAGYAWFSVDCGSLDDVKAALGCNKDFRGGRFGPYGLHVCSSDITGQS
ncbi:MAG TPA: hypothetical protein VI455_03995 [Terriglobia bacterium]